ncbi:hypothetical protein AMS68_004076 [Peltaster fructicola]|uniref:Tubulin-specific chaperone A n=1 Tax=Peltaster fructicola TaxID=286661 RepID=A0A6H0XVA9_9PEZI|nr:hypothetical protein AMS68_004076 [Peltaster fructicola]
MAPSSSLKIATSAVNRLVKEEASYHKELEQQQARIAKLQKPSDDENAEYLLRQEAADETKAMFPELRQKIEEALSNLERGLSQSKSDSSEDVASAQEAVNNAKTALKQISA